MRKQFGFGLAAMVLAASLTSSTSTAALHSYSFTLTGPSENPPNASPGTGTGSAVYDDEAGTLQLTAVFGGLMGTVTQTHFHAVTSVSGLPDTVGETLEQAASATPNAGIAVGNTTLPGFPLGVTNGIYSETLNLNDPSIYGVTFLNNNGGTAAGARATFVDALATGRTYWNIHTTSFGGGEIRGFPVLVPEPATFGLALAAWSGAWMIRRRK